MAIGKDLPIKAADVNSYNKHFVTRKDQSFNEFGVILDFAPHDDGYNINLNIPDSQNYRLLVWDPTRTTQYIYWEGDDAVPSVNIGGWANTEVTIGDLPYKAVRAPEGQFLVEVEITVSVSYVWTLLFYQGQTNLNVGDKVRVWNADWSELLPEEATLITAALTLTGKLGA